MTPQEFMDMFEVKLNGLEQERNIAALKHSNVRAMLTADTGGLTCNATGCYSKAEYFGTRVHFCQSHMMIAVAS